MTVQTIGTLGVRFFPLLCDALGLPPIYQDVEVHHLETATPLVFKDIKVISEGPLRASIQSVIKYGKSTITTTVSNICAVCRRG
jgi:hypothetical protein